MVASADISTQNMFSIRAICMQSNNLRVFDFQISDTREIYERTDWENAIENRKYQHQHNFRCGDKPEFPSLHIIITIQYYDIRTSMYVTQCKSR